MNYTSLFLLCLFLLPSCQSKESEQTASHVQLSTSIDELVSAYRDLGIFSGVVLVAEEGVPYYHKAFGEAKRKANIKNTLSTRFAIGSMNKTCTKLVILQLIDEGKLSMNGLLIDYLDDFHQPESHKITISHLLAHQSGFGDYYSPDFWVLPIKSRNTENTVALIRKMPLLFGPGTEQEYSNAGYVLLAAIIEKVTKMSYAENVLHRIKEPLNLKGLLLQKIKSDTNRAIGYMKGINGYTNNEDMISEPLGDGGFYSTASDILKLHRAYFYDYKLLDSTARQNDDFLNQIKPFYSEKGRGIPLAGGYNGANTIHIEMLADNISIIVCANMDEPVAEKIANGIFQLINNKSPELAKLPAKLEVYEKYQLHGILYVKKHFNSLISNWFDNDPKDIILNSLGYELIEEGQIEVATLFLKLNTELFPEVANCWDSYAEVLAKAGKADSALFYYKKALEIDPNLLSAKKAIEKQLNLGVK